MEGNRIAHDEITDYINIIFTGERPFLFTQQATHKPTNNPDNNNPHNNLDLELDPIAQEHLQYMHLDPMLSTFWHEIPTLTLSRARQHAYGLFLDCIEDVADDSAASLLTAYARAITKISTKCTSISSFDGITLSSGMTHFLYQSSSSSDIFYLAEVCLVRCIIHSLIHNLTNHANILDTIFREMLAARSDRLELVRLHELAVGLLDPKAYCQCLLDTDEDVSDIECESEESEAVVRCDCEAHPAAMAEAETEVVSPLTADFTVATSSASLQVPSTIAVHDPAADHPAVLMYQILILVLVFVSGAQAGYIAGNL